MGRLFRIVSTNGEWAALVLRDIFVGIFSVLLNTVLIAALWDRTGEMGTAGTLLRVTSACAVIYFFACAIHPSTSSRLYALLSRDFIAYMGCLCFILFGLLMGCSLISAWPGSFWGGVFSFIVGPILAMLFVSMGVHFWLTIPPRIRLTSPEAAERVLSKRKYVLILWSRQDYADLTKRTELGMDWGSSQSFATPHMRYQDDSWDAAALKAARRFECETIRLWVPGESELVGEESKGLQVLCSDSNWKDVVVIAMHHAFAILVYRGKGNNLEWELDQITAETTLKKKTVFNARSVESLTSEISRVTGKAAKPPAFNAS